MARPIAEGNQLGRGVRFWKLRQVREAALGYEFLAPALILLLAFEFFPIVYGLYVRQPNSEQNRFARGQILFIFSSSSGLPFCQQAVSKGLKFKWDFDLLPYTDKPAVNLYGASISVYKTTPEKQLASWLVIKLLAEKAQSTKWSENTGYLPVRKSAKDDVVNFFKTNPSWGPDLGASYAKLFDWTPYTMVESPVAGYDPVRTAIDQDVMGKVITDSTVDPKTLLDSAVTKSNQVLKENAPQ